MTDAQFQGVASAAVMGRGDSFFLAWLVDGEVCSADETAAQLLGYTLLGLVTLVDGRVVCRLEPQDMTLACRVSEFYTQQLERLPAGELFRLELERWAGLPDTRSSELNTRLGREAAD